MAEGKQASVVEDGRCEPWRGDGFFTLAVALLALLPRLYVAIAWAREAVWDGHYYHFGAERIAAGFGYSQDVVRDGVTVWKPWTHYPVGYSALLGGIYRFFGSGQYVAPLVNAALSILLVVAAHRLARCYLTTRRARIAALLVALHPGLISYVPLVMTELTSALLVLGVVLVVVTLGGRTWGALAAGAAIGLTAYVRPASLLLVLLIPLAATPWASWRALGRTALAAAAALLVLLPWTVRNCQVMDGCALISTNGGWNLAIGALTETGRFHTLRAEDGCKVVTGQVQQDRCWMQVGLRQIAADPVAWLGKMPRKVAQTFDHESFPIEYLHQADPELWQPSRREAGRRLLSAWHWALVIAAFGSVVAWPPRLRRRPRALVVQALLGACGLAYGLWAVFEERLEHPIYPLVVALPLVAALPLAGRPPQGPTGRALLGTLALTILTHAIFFGEDRYHVVTIPALCLLAAGALRPPLVSSRS